MRPVTSWIAPLTALALALGPADELRPVYPAGLEVVCESESSASSELRRLDAWVAGQKLPPEAVDPMRASFPEQRSSERMRTMTRYESIAAGRPTAARRSFDRLRRTESKGEESVERVGPLEGRTIRLTRDASGDARVELVSEAGKADVAASSLADHRFEPEVEDYLPARPARVGERWELGDAAVRRAFGVEGVPELFEQGADRDSLEEKMRRGARVSGEVLYEKREQRAGRPCALLRAELAAEVFVNELDPNFFGAAAARGGAPRTGSMKLSLRLVDSVWFDCATGRPLEASAELGSDMVLRASVPERALEFEVVAAMTGEQRRSWKER